MSSHASLVLAAALVALTVAGVHARRRAALKLPRVSRRWRRELRVAATVARECGLAILDATARKEAGLAAGERKKVLIVGARAAGSRVVANCL